MIVDVLGNAGVIWAPDIAEPTVRAERCSPARAGLTCFRGSAKYPQDNHIELLQPRLSSLYREVFSGQAYSMNFFRRSGVPG